MYCNNCGHELFEGQIYCSKCGKQVAAAQPAAQPTSQPTAQPYAQPTSQPYAQPTAQPYAQPYAQPEQQEVRRADGTVLSPSSVLTWGIMGLVFSCTFFLSFLGIIFSAVGLKKANEFRQLANGSISRQVNIGRGLSIGGIISGIALTVLLILYIVLIAALLSHTPKSNIYFNDWLFKGIENLLVMM